jgi:hypothetical protein
VARYRSKIVAAAERRRALGGNGDLGPGALAVGEWQALGLALPDVDALRAYRLGRVRAELAARDLAGAVLTDPINLRYATDSPSMQLWCDDPAALREPSIHALGPAPPDPWEDANDCDALRGEASSHRFWPVAEDAGSRAAGSRPPLGRSWALWPTPGRVAPRPTRLGRTTLLGRDQQTVNEPLSARRPAVLRTRWSGKQPPGPAA